MKKLLLIIVIPVLAGCVYFNTMYHAETAFEQGVHGYQSDERTGEGISRETRQHFQRTVEKGKKVLTEYKDSKYVDEAYILVGKSYYYLQQFELARKYLNELINGHPESPHLDEARLFLGKALFELGEMRAATNELQTLLQNSENTTLRAEAYLALADLHMKQSRYTQMLENVQRAIDIAQDDEMRADAAWRTALWALSQENYEQADKFLTQAADFTHKPQFDRMIRLEQARLYRKMGELDRAESEVRGMLAKETYRSLWPELQVERGRVLEAREDTARAANLYRLVIGERVRYMEDTTATDTNDEDRVDEDTGEEEEREGDRQEEQIRRENLQTNQNQPFGNRGNNQQRNRGQNRSQNNQTSSPFESKDPVVRNDAYYQLATLAFRRNNFAEANKYYKKMKSTGDDDEEVTEAKYISKAISTYQNLLSERESLEEKFIRMKNAPSGPDTAVTPGSTAENQTASPSRSARAAGKNSPDSVITTVSGKKLIPLEPKEETEEREQARSEKKVKFSAEELYSWLTVQDSLDGLNEYANTLYQMAEVLVFDLDRVQRGMALADTVYRLAENPEIQARSLLLQAHVYHKVLNQPEQGEDIETRILQDFSDTEIAERVRRKRGEVLMSESTAGDTSSGKKPYSSADSLIAAGEYEEAVSRFRTVHQRYPASEYGKRAIYALGWMYEHRIMNLDSALAYYKKYQAEYPDTELSSTVKDRIEELQNIYTALNPPEPEPVQQPEPSSPSPDSVSQTQTPDTTRSPAKELPVER